MSPSESGEPSQPTAAGLSAFQQTILTVLAEETRYGLAIKRELETYFDKDPSHYRVYTNLDELTEQGLVARRERDGRTNEYALTNAGYHVLLGQLAWQAERLGTDNDRADELRAVVEAALDSV